MTTLVIGTGFVGTEVAAALRARDTEVIQTSRTEGAGDVAVADGAALDCVLAGHKFDQVVLVAQLTKSDIDWVLERIDGPRWLVFSSHQVTALTTAPYAHQALGHEEVALTRGACVLRPTMIYGKGRDKNLSRLIRLLRRSRVPVVPGDGRQLIQPLHIDDLVELIVCHKKAWAPGLFQVGGAEALPMAELVATLAQILGLRCPVVAIPQTAMRLAAKFGSLFGVRPDQVRRLTEPKIVDLSHTTATFKWLPAPLGLRLEQAVMEAAPVRGNVLAHKAARYLME